MKTKSIVFALLACFTFGLTSCEDMLSPDNERHAGWDQVASDTLYGYWGVLRTLQNLGERYVILGEARGDLVAPTEFTSDTIAAIADFRDPQDGDCRYLRASDFYAVINSCNAYLAKADTLRPIYGANAGDNDKYMMREYSQVWTIRAWTYLQLVQLYDEVPFYTKPLMSTADVDAFYNGGNCPKANRHTLAQLIEDEAGEHLQSIITQDYPRYGMYNGMVHSYFCYFPPQVVLGDIWLMCAQNTADYEKAAQYYFDYIDRYQAVLPTDYYCQASENQGGRRGDMVEYSFGSQMKIFNVSGTDPKSDVNSIETITVIPSTTNKLWGIIQRGVNEVFGFPAKVSVSTSASDTTTNATVTLQTSARPQLVASAGFRQLCSDYPCLAQKCTEVNGTYKITDYDTIETGADARRAWSKQVSFTDEGKLQNGEYIVKQNPFDRSPGNAYSTTYPVIYRKAHVWLRLAEAINRAGFPEYAYAILADGVSEELTPSAQANETNYFAYYYTLTDTLGHITPFVNYDDAMATFDADAERAEAEVDGKPFYTAVTERSDLKLYSDGYRSATLDTLPQGVVTPEFINDCLINGVYVEKDDNAGNAIYSGSYIPYNQAIMALSKPYMNFGKETFSVKSNNNGGGGLSRNHGVHGRSHCTRSGSNSYRRMGDGSVLPTFCETMPSNEDRFRDSVMNKFYNFDLNVSKKWAEYPGKLNYFATDKGVYAEYQEKLIEAVEELIVDEMGMELCFEGNRFNDLVRIAERRGDTSWLAKKIANRTGEENAELYTKLLDKQNWFFKLPNR